MRPSVAGRGAYFILPARLPAGVDEVAGSREFSGLPDPPQSLSEEPKATGGVAGRIHARGDATEDSDVDLVVLQKEFVHRGEEYLRLIDEVHKSLTRVDLILMREEDFEWKSTVGGTLPYWAKKEGRVLHDFK